MVRLTLLLIICFLLSGCSSVATIHRDSTGKVWKVETRGECKTVIKQDGEEIEQDTKREPLIKIGVEMPLNKIGM